jgi:hypothetical protein
MTDDREHSRNARDRYPGFIVLSDFASQGENDGAVEFTRGGSRRKLMARLMALGMTPDEIRWHAKYPGRRMATLAGSRLDDDNVALRVAPSCRQAE